MLRTLVSGVLRTARAATRGRRLQHSGIIPESQQKYQPRSLRLYNGDKAAQAFSAQEMERRLRLLRNHMAAENIDACVLTSYHNINYFTGFLYLAMGRPYAAIVTHDKVTTVSSGVDYGQPWRRTYGDNIVYTDWQKDNYYHVIGKELEATKRIGLEFDHVHLTMKDKFQAAMPGAQQGEWKLGHAKRQSYIDAIGEMVDFRMVDVTDPTMRMRMVKSAEEIVLTKEAAKICELGGEMAKKALYEGVPEYKVASASTEAMVEAISKRYPDLELRDTWTWVQSGINTDGGHNPLTSRKIQKGDILSMNHFAMIAGYYAALERTMFYDHMPSDRHLEVWEANVEVHRRGIELIKPGVRCCDIAKELNEIFLSKNLIQYRTIGYGHSVGVLCHYYGREAGLELREDVETVIEPNMVVTMEPMLVIPEGKPGAGGYREHDILVVNETGSENITSHVPLGPDHNIIKN